MAAADDSQIYRDLMRFKPAHLSPNAWAVEAGVSRAVWSDMRRHGNPSRRTLEKLLIAVGSTIAEFEALRVGHESASSAFGAEQFRDSPGWNWNPASVPPLPLIVTNPGGDWGEIGSRIELTEVRPQELADRVPRPPTLVNDREAYAIVIVGDSMWPRYRTGRRIAVSPKAPIALGDDVLVRLRLASSDGNGREMALIKELVRRTAAHLELRQFNPDRTFRVQADDVREMHKVIGELF